MKLPRRAQRLLSSGPGPMLNWVGVIIGIVGSIVTVVTAIVSVRGGLTAWQLTVLMSAVVIGYVIVVTYLVYANGPAAR